MSNLRKIFLVFSYTMHITSKVQKLVNMQGLLKREIPRKSKFFKFYRKTFIFLPHMCKMSKQIEFNLPLKGSQMVILT